MNASSDIIFIGFYALEPVPDFIDEVLIPNLDNGECFSDIPMPGGMDFFTFGFGFVTDIDNEDSQELFVSGFWASTSDGNKPHKLDGWYRVGLNQK